VELGGSDDLREVGLPGRCLRLRHVPGLHLLEERDQALGVPRVARRLAGKEPIKVRVAQVSHLVHPIPATVGRVQNGTPSLENSRAIAAIPRRCSAFTAPRLFPTTSAVSTSVRPAMTLSSSPCRWSGAQ